MRWNWINYIYVVFAIIIVLDVFLNRLYSQSFKDVLLFVELVLLILVIIVESIRFFRKKNS